MRFNLVIHSHLHTFSKDNQQQNTHMYYKEMHKLTQSSQSRQKANFPNQDLEEKEKNRERNKIKR